MAFAAFLLCLAELSGAAPSPVVPRELLLEVVINGNDTDKIASFSERDGHLYISAEELAAIGIVPPTNEPRTAIDITHVAGLTYELDEAAQTVRIRLPPRALATQTIGRTSVVSPTEAQSPTGVLVNYDVIATAQASSIDVYGLGSARVFGSFGTVQGDFSLARSRAGFRAVRLGTTYAYSDPARLRTIAVGDVISGSLPYSRSLRLGGAQVTTNFGLRPDLITRPLPTVGGSATVPSTVDVLVNGVRQLNTEVAAGPFTVPQLPVVSGAGQISVSVTDPAGRQTIQTIDFYASDALLRPGLSSVSLEAGAIRRGFGVDSFDYGPLALSATARRGLSPSLTIEGHAEAAAHLALATGGATMKIAKFAIATASIGASGSGSGLGGQAYISVERSAPKYHIGFSALATTKRYRDLGSLVGDPPPGHIIQANLGVVLGRQGSLGVAYTDVEQRAVTAAAGFGNGFSIAVPFVRPRIRTSLVSATYSREVFGRVYAYTTAYADLRNHNRAAMVGISFRFGGRGSVNASYDTAARQATLEASRPAVDPGDIGWRAYVAGGNRSRALGEVRYRATQADLGFGLSVEGRSFAAQASASGSLVFIGGSAFAANTITDGFAVVDTQGQARVPVSLNNRPVGVTNRGGKLLVPGLIAYQPNRIEIDPSNLPINAEWDRLETRIAPAARAGAIARFAIARHHQVLLTIRLPDGEPLPVGSRVELGRIGPVSEVGFDGQAYFSDLVGTHHAIAETPDGHQCRIDVRVPATAQWPLQLDTVCHPNANLVDPRTIADATAH